MRDGDYLPKKTSNAESVTTEIAVDTTMTALERLTKVLYCCAKTNTGTPLVVQPAEG
jgi:hypothetical protein